MAYVVFCSKNIKEKEKDGGFRVYFWFKDFDRPCSNIKNEKKNQARSNRIIPTTIPKSTLCIDQNEKRNKIMFYVSFYTFDSLVIWMYCDGI